VLARGLVARPARFKPGVDLGRKAGPGYNLDDAHLYEPREGRVAMASEKQDKANRQNAKKSTGPKTPQGKAAVRFNAAKHGLLSEETLLPGEDGAALEELAERLRAELRPAGDLEGLLVERIVAAHWRLRRLGRVEAGVFAWQFYGEQVKRAADEVRRYEKHESLYDDDLVQSLMTRVTITDEQKHLEAQARVREISAMRDTENATLGRTFVRDAEGANAFLKLSRYETAIERSLYKALHELQRLQAARRAGGGDGVPPPVAVDVDVSGLPG
jgi:hypothetical protein